MIVRLLPFGNQFRPIPSNGVRVAIGPGAWDFQKRHHCPIMVLPEEAQINDYEWLTDGRSALVFERGPPDDDRLVAVAEALLCAGASSVVAIREALLDGDDPRVFFDPVIRYVSD